MIVLVQGGKPQYSEKNPRSKVRTNKKLNPHMEPGAGIGPGWDGSARGIFQVI